MSGQNVPVIDMPPGVNRNGTPYLVGKAWYNCNQVRWVNNSLTPIGGWVAGNVFGASPEIVRDTFSWRDNLKNAWYAVGSTTHLRATSPSAAVTNIYDITPTGLVSSSAAKKGFGSGAFGKGKYGVSQKPSADAIGQWSMDNYGRQLVSVHSQDGRLFMWDPTTPSTVSIPVVGAPIDNTLVVVTEERMVMLLGGKNNPRRVKWCSRENMGDWTPTATNTAGGFELHSSGMIIAAVKVQSGILVITDVDTHIIEYVGPPSYYGRRKIADEVGILGKNTIASVMGGAFWLNGDGFWKYDGNVTPIPTTIDSEILRESNLSEPANVFMGYNGHNREVWAFYPGTGGDLANRYVFLSMAASPYWSMGAMSRTAFMNPIWQTRPYMYNGVQEYQHETGWLANGSSRNNIFAETGQFEIGEGDKNMWVDRIWQDASVEDDAVTPGNPAAYDITFKLNQAPGDKRRTVGPVTLDTVKGYTTVRFRAREITMRINQSIDEAWSMGKLRLRLKAGGGR
jgi:hypothetical protein